MVSDQIIFAMRQRIAAGTSIYAIAKATGISQSIIGRFLNEKREIRSSTLDTLAAYLGLGLAPLESSKSPATQTPTAAPPVGRSPAKAAIKAPSKPAKGSKGSKGKPAGSKRSGRR